MAAQVRVDGLTHGLIACSTRHRECDYRRGGSHEQPAGNPARPIKCRAHGREATRGGYAPPVQMLRLMRGRSTVFLLALNLQRDVDELVFLTTDQLALTGPVQQLVGRNAVTLGLTDRVLEEAGIDAGVTHDQCVAVQQAFGRHGRCDYLFGGVGYVEEVDPGLYADLVEHPDQRLDRRVARAGAEPTAG